MRHFLFAAIVSLIAGGTAFGDELYIEYEVQRWGGDYATLEISTARACGEECARDPNCQAWTWSRPYAEGPNAVCHLKSEVPFWTNNPCCESGVMVGTSDEARPRSVARAMQAQEQQSADVSAD